MMPSFVVQKVKQVQAGEGEKGPWTKQKVRITTAEGFEDVLLFCNQFSPVPAEGSTLEGEIGDPFRPGQLREFKRARKGAYNGRSGAPRDFKADPVKQAAIAAESAQKSAVEILRIAVECGAYKPSDANPISEMTTVVRSAAESLYQQIQQASEAAK